MSLFLTIIFFFFKYNSFMFNAFSIILLRVFIDIGFLLMMAARKDVSIIADLGSMKWRNT